MKIIHESEVQARSENVINFEDDTKSFGMWTCRHVLKLADILKLDI